jgi:hypothetical protein
MASRFLGSLLVLMPLALAAQSLQERPVPLNDWPAPRRLQRSQLQGQQRAVSPKLPLAATSDSLAFVAMAPCRVADTRPGTGYSALGVSPLTSLTPVTLPVEVLLTASIGALPGACGIPAPAGNLEAYSLNVTVVPPTGTSGGYLLVYPNPQTPIPLAASLTWNSGAAYQTNAVIAEASSDGSVNVVVNIPTNVVVDINGYYEALPNPSLGFDTNTLLGYDALQAGGAGGDNTAVGFAAMSETTSGGYNTALGAAAMLGNGRVSGGGGSFNTAVGAGALNFGFGASGSNNIALGAGAGADAAAGNNNIMIGNTGFTGDNNTIRIGQGPMTATYIQGISGNVLSGASPVVINSSGQLGVESVSSRRYKEDIQDMGDASNSLLRLRPVTFHYKKPNPDTTKPLEYGLIAEEVAGVYPDLVIRGADGQIESVQYAKLPAMLLNELQKEHRSVEEQAETIKKLEARLAALEAQLATNATAKVTSGKTALSSEGGR